jgi:uncharacterized protein (TIGR03435 family)
MSCRLQMSCVVLAGLACAQVSRAQAPAQFEVASIKPNTSGQGRALIRPAPGGRLTVENFSLRMLLTFAYKVRDFQISGGPAWMNSDRYDIVAKADSNVVPEEMMTVLLQALLEDRFQLKVHRETKELPIYALVAAKSGFKFDEPKEGPCVKIDPAAPPKPRAPGEKLPNYCGTFMIGPRTIDATQISTEQLATGLSNIMGRKVFDKTGYTGMLDVHLEWRPDESTAALGALMGPAPGEQANPGADSAGASIFTVLQERLGLKLESQKGPVEILVVDHAEKATEN